MPLSRLDLPHVLESIHELNRTIKHPPAADWQAPVWLMEHCNKTTAPYDARTRPGHSWLIHKAAEEVLWRLSPPYGGGTDAITDSQLDIHKQAALCELSRALSDPFFGTQLAADAGERVEFLAYLKTALATLADDSDRRRRTSGKAETSEGEKRPDSHGTTQSILPVMLSASDLAKHIGRKRGSVTSFLTRFARRFPDCRMENKLKRKNEPTYLYRTVDVWPALVQWAEGKGEQPKHDPVTVTPYIGLWLS